MNRDDRRLGISRRPSHNCHKSSKCENSVFRRGVVDAFGFLGRYAAQRMLELFTNV